MNKRITWNTGLDITRRFTGAFIMVVVAHAVNMADADEINIGVWKAVIFTFAAPPNPSAGGGVGERLLYKSLYEAQKQSTRRRGAEWKDAANNYAASKEINPIYCRETRRCGQNK